MGQPPLKCSNRPSNTCPPERCHGAAFTAPPAGLSARTVTPPAHRAEASLPGWGGIERDPLYTRGGGCSLDAWPMTRSRMVIPSRGTRSSAYRAMPASPDGGLARPMEASSPGASRRHLAGAAAAAAPCNSQGGNPRVCSHVPSAPPGHACTPYGTTGPPRAPSLAQRCGTAIPPPVVETAAPPASRGLSRRRSTAAASPPVCHRGGGVGEAARRRGAGPRHDGAGLAAVRRRRAAAAGAAAQTARRPPLIGANRARRLPPTLCSVQFSWHTTAAGLCTVHRSGQRPWRDGQRTAARRAVCQS